MGFEITNSFSFPIYCDFKKETLMIYPQNYKSSRIKINSGTTMIFHQFKVQNVVVKNYRNKNQIDGFGLAQYG